MQRYNYSVPNEIRMAAHVAIVSTGPVLACNGAYAGSGCEIVEFTSHVNATGHADEVQLYLSELQQCN